MSRSSHNWASSFFFAGLDLAIAGLAHFFKPRFSHNWASQFFSMYVFNHIVGLVDLKTSSYVDSRRSHFVNTIIFHISQNHSSSSMFNSCCLLFYQRTVIIHYLHTRGVHSMLRLGTTWVRIFDPPMYVLKHHLKIVKKNAVVKHNLELLLYKFQKKSIVDIFKLIFEAKNNAF